MKRRGFLGSLITLAAGSALPVKSEEKPLIQLETLPKETQEFIQGKSRFIASGWIDEEGAERYWKSRDESVEEFWKRELDKE
jgi:hypothetical protein